jgi:hypothetical protein
MSRRPGAPRRFYEALRRRMSQASLETGRRARDWQVDRVLGLLSEDKLLAQAATKLDPGDGLLIECGVLGDDVWEDPRVVARVRELERQGIKAERVEHAHTVAGRAFARPKLKITF